MNKYEALGRYTKLHELITYLLDEMNNYAKQCDKPEFQLIKNMIVASTIVAENIHQGNSQKVKQAQQSDG